MQGSHIHKLRLHNYIKQDQNLMQKRSKFCEIKVDPDVIIPNYDLGIQQFSPIPTGNQQSDDELKRKGEIDETYRRVQMIWSSKQLWNGDSSHHMEFR